MGNHTAGLAMGLMAKQMLDHRSQEQTALSILDSVCEPYRNCDAEFESQDPNQLSHVHPEFDDYTYPHPKAALGMLMVEAFAPNGINDLPKYQGFSMSMLLESDQPYDETKGDAAWEKWSEEILNPFRERYGFC
jgi:hypothetical protein